MHEVLVNRLGGLSLPRKSVVRLIDLPDMTLDVYRGRKTTIQQQQLILSTVNYLSLLIGGLQQQSNVHFYNDTMTHEHRYAEDVSRTKEQTTQTETIFGLKDLPTVTEIVNNKIQEKKKQEEPDLSGKYSEKFGRLKYSGTLMAQTSDGL